SALGADRVETVACLVEFDAPLDEVGDELVHRGQLRIVRGLAAVDSHHGQQSAIGGRIVQDEGVGGQIHLDGGQSAGGAGGDDRDLDVPGAGACAHRHRRDVGGEVEDHPRLVLARFGG